MDPNTLDTSNALPLVVNILPIPPVGPRILQLSPIPGNIYMSDRFFYDHTADIAQGDFGVVLAFASAHGHPTVVHKCLDLQAFQVAHPLAIVRHLLEVPPAILAQGWFLLSRGITLAPPAAPPAPAPPASKWDPSTSIEHCCSTCFIKKLSVVQLPAHLLVHWLSACQSRGGSTFMWEYFSSSSPNWRPPHRLHFSYPSTSTSSGYAFFASPLP